ncbi:hypothetical protein AKJ57_04595 [candidate division MSBL1 archaeon SCGC-AAA259A05]|uniref:ABC transmembrane type-1 domain-containing protein n=1 Tax=candidate division MSBL1 archaeon SCGC-AAA259A05 TaxID=1698259 RepID=A0A133U711_9EURY|nr:hypothetical protein AKJ57_04595 [candidate division MSBL1 archaeon SCGC-AAA259A05]
MQPKKEVINMARETGKFGKLRKIIIGAIEHRYAPYIVGALILIFILAPMYWTVAQAFKPYAEVMQWPPTVFPQAPTLGNFDDVLVTSPIPTYIMNSLIYSLSTTAFVLVVGSLAAYGLSKYSFPGSGKVSTAFFLTRIIPPIAMILPFFLIYTQLGLNDTRWSVVLFTIYICFPLSIWLLKSFFDQFPDELIESARVDGCSRLGILWRIVLPVAAPGLAAVSCITFMWTWSSFIGPYLFINSNAIKPITVGIYYFVGDEMILWHQLSAAGILCAIPGIIFFFIAQKYIISGLTAGALKGTV